MSAAPEKTNSPTKGIWHSFLSEFPAERATGGFRPLTPHKTQSGHLIRTQHCLIGPSQLRNMPGDASAEAASALTGWQRISRLFGYAFARTDANEEVEMPCGHRMSPWWQAAAGTLAGHRPVDC